MPPICNKYHCGLFSGNAKTDHAGTMETISRTGTRVLGSQEVNPADHEDPDAISMIVAVKGSLTGKADLIKRKPSSDHILLIYHLTNIMSTGLVTEE